MARAVPMASAANPAAPRAEFAVPPRSPGRGDHRCAQRGPDRGGQRVQAADQQALALDLGMPVSRRPVCGARRSRFCIRVDFDEGQRVLARQQRRPAGQLTHQLAVDHHPAGAHSPRHRTAGATRVVDGARSPPNRSGIAPCRSRSMSSMLSAPAAIPATRHVTFSCALTPHSPPGRTCTVNPARQPGAVRQGHHRDQPGPRHEIRVIKRCVRPRQGYANNLTYKVSS